MRCERARFTFALFSMIGVTAEGPAFAQVLERVETEHKEPHSAPPESSGEPIARPTRLRSHARADRQGDEREHSFAWPCLILGPWTGYCFYGKSWLRADRSDSPQSVAPRSAHAVPAKDWLGNSVGELDEAAETPTDSLDGERRYGELRAGTFAGFTENVYGIDVAARGWLWMGGVDVSWVRLHEPNALAPNIRDVDLVRVSVVGAFLAEKYVEAHVLLGADALHGREWTPGFGPGLELRSYPAKRVTLAGEFRASIFAKGYPLVDTRLEAGIVLGRLDLRAGAHWVYQASDRTAASILGPCASVLVRLGP